MTDYQRIRQKIVFDVLDRFPEHGNRTLAIKLFTENPEFFRDLEDARHIIRYYRGAYGDRDRKKVINGKYFRPTA